MQYFITFLEGIITFISPCILPMIPVYLLYFTAENDSNKKHSVFFNSLGFVLGFTVIFTILGAFAGVVGGLLTEYRILLNLITGAVVVVFGLGFLGIFNLSFLKGFQFKRKKSSHEFFSAVLFGVIFSVGWTPCTGAFLGSALMLASQSGSAVTGIFMLLSYSLGMGVPFVLSAVLANRIKNTFDFLKRHTHIIEIASGVLLIIIGIAMMTGLWGRLISLLS